MTSASGLFSNHLRARSGSRNPNPNADLLEASLNSDLHRRPSRRRTRHHGHDCGPSGHRVRDIERELLQDSSNHPNNSRTGNNINGGTTRSRVNQLAIMRNCQRNERLPGTVLQAQERLIERLRGISLTGNRRHTAESDSGMVDSEDLETEMSREWFESDAAVSVLAPDTNQANTSKKPPGLGWEAKCSLAQEVFKVEQEYDGVVRASVECSICLERLCEGDRLFRLPCYHRFHLCCLEPWLQDRRDCPYCRASI